MADERADLEKALTSEETSLMRPLVTSRPGHAPYDQGYANYGADPGADGVHLRELWRIVRKRKWLVSLIACVATILLTIEVHRTPSIYQAYADILVGKEAATVVQTKDQVIQIDDSDNLNTNKFIIKSSPLLEDVVVNLGLDRNPKFTESLQKKTFTDAVKDIWHRVSGGLTRARERNPEPPVSSSPGASQELTPEDSKRLKPFVDVLKDKLEVEPQPESQILRVSFKHTDPELAAAVVNSATKIFIDRSFERKTSRFTDTSGWLDRSTRELKSKVQESQAALADYTRRNGIYTTDGKENLTTDKMTSLQAEATKAEVDRMLKQSLYDEVKLGRVTQLPQAFSDPKIGMLQAELGKLHVEASELSVKYGPENPRVAEVQEKIKTYRAQIEENRVTLEEKLKADYERSARDERSIKQALGRAKGEAVQQNHAASEYGALKADVETMTSMYTEFLKQTKQADLQLAEQHNNLRVIEPADVPGSPIGPMRLRTILIGFLVSLIGGVGLAFFLEYLDNTVKSVDDIVRIAQLPTLAVIPSINTETTRALSSRKRENGDGAGSVGNGLSLATTSHLSPDKTSRLVALDHLSSVVEAYRMLRTSVLLSAAGNPPKTILFTSGQPGEGKTTTSINTAISLAQLGSSVLLIDADLRRPAVHKIFKLNQGQGLSTFLSRQVEIDSLIQKLWVPNLYVLPCGAIPPNPAELISSERMKEALRDLSGKFDHILIDSPPLINVTDPVILSTMVDGVILVIQAGRSTRDVLRRARQELNSVGAKIFGVVLNNLDVKREGYDSYVATYGAYGYGNAREEASR
ncbi:MAG TPA: polysaccharide biosynthesis tyrosine autokinase [Blastocatellia bacterium]|nr:polysaccharide biosynthesis tyrosine autokinase [Blastocatellia bacterium]